MIRIFYGEDRKGISEKVRQIFGEEYEVFEGVSLSSDQLPSLFFGTSLFVNDRRILIKDLGENKEGIFGKIKDYLSTAYDVIIWESKFDKRTAIYKEFSKLGVEMREFKLLESFDSKIALNIFDVALKDGPRAIKMIEKIETNEDPFQFVGLLTTQAIKKFSYRNGSKEKRVLKELSKLDINMKSTQLSPWLLLKSFLLELSSL